MWFSIVLACQCYSSQKEFEKIIAKTFPVFSKPTLSVVPHLWLLIWETQNSDLSGHWRITRSWSTSYCFIPLNSAYNNCLWFTVSTTSWVLTIAALTRKECSMPTAKASFTILLTSSFAKNLPSLFVKVGHHIFALHQQLLIIFIAKQNVWLTLKIYLKI